MPADAPYAHTASIVVNATPDAAFAFMASGEQQSNWALGSWDRRLVGDDLWVGRSLFDGGEHFVRIEGHPELRLVDYRVGAAADAMLHKVEARVIDGAPLGHPEGSSVITMTVWRGRNDRPEIWARTFHTWEVEMHLIKHLIEAGPAADANDSEESAS